MRLSHPTRCARRWRAAPLLLALAAWPLTGAAQSAAAPAAKPGAAAPAACPALLRHEFARLQDEKPQPLCQYAGQVLLVVNTASYCGFTPQYKALEALYERYRARGLVVLGFPSNDFAQETGSNQQIAEFCESTFGVKFPMFAKSHVTGPGATPFYKLLAQQGGQAPRWNFHKYLIDRQGRVVGTYASMVDPQSRALVQRIEALLAEPAPR